MLKLKIKLGAEHRQALEKVVGDLIPMFKTPEVTQVFWRLADPENWTPEDAEGDRVLSLTVSKRLWVHLFCALDFEACDHRHDPKAFKVFSTLAHRFRVAGCESEASNA